MGTSAARCQGNVREFQSVWRVVTLNKMNWDKTVFEATMIVSKSP